MHPRPSRRGREPGRLFRYQASTPSGSACGLHRQEVEAGVGARRRIERLQERDGRDRLRDIRHQPPARRRHRVGACRRRRRRHQARTQVGQRADAQRPVVGDRRTPSQVPPPCRSRPAKMREPDAVPRPIQSGRRRMPVMEFVAVGSQHQQPGPAACRWPRQSGTRLEYLVVAFAVDEVEDACGARPALDRRLHGIGCRWWRRHRQPVDLHPGLQCRFALPVFLAQALPSPRAEPSLRISRGCQALAGLSSGREARPGPAAAKAARRAVTRDGWIR